MLLIIRIPILSPDQHFKKLSAIRVKGKFGKKKLHKAHACFVTISAIAPSRDAQFTMPILAQRFKLLAFPVKLSRLTGG